ncbi:MAG: small ribosomal subunit Rsm22 family protein [Nitrospirota bacterium]
MVNRTGGPRSFRLSEAVLRALSEVSGRRGPDEAGRADQEVVRGVLRLSRLFTRERDSLAASYLDDDRLRLAYLSYYVPVNLAKVRLLLEEMPPPQGAGSSQPFLVLDLGSGPGSASLALLDWFTDRLGLGNRPLQAIAMDRSQRALRDCADLWRAYERIAPVQSASLLTLQADLERTARLDRMAKREDRPYDLIVVSHALNELFRKAREPVERRVELVRDLLGRLDRHGTLLIVEPALRETARELHRFRDRLVADGACTVYSPCLHERPCPALVKEEDWCHEERPWTPPPVVAALDREVGFIKDALKFAYLILRKDGKSLVRRAPDVYRAVSELRVMKGEKRAWLCNETGRPEVGRLDRERSATNEAFDDWHRGAIVRIDQIVRAQRKDREATVGRIPASANIEVIRSI